MEEFDALARLLLGSGLEAKGVKVVEGEVAVRAGEQGEPQHHWHLSDLLHPFRKAS